MSRTRLLCAVAMATAAVGWMRAAPPPHADDQMCGDGTTFTVSLPGVAHNRLGDPLPADAITLPRGCRIYAFLVSGYARNPDFNELTFYKFAKVVAEQHGYVHYSWWNNLLKPYMAGPLHAQAPILGAFGTNPGGLSGITVLGFGPPLGPGNAVETLYPKAVPEEDDQFQADAAKVIKAVRANNPTAIIAVAGHSMGGAAVAKLGALADVPIDLLAPIDPVGNRTFPVGQVGQPNYNWTRFRATHTFKGYRQMDCVRSGALDNCKDFDDRLLFKEYHCGPVGDFSDAPPFPASRVPLVCPGPYVDPGKVITIGAQVKHLMYRWQREAVFPFDFAKDYKFTYVGTDTKPATGPTIAAQYGLDKNTLLGEDPYETCADNLLFPTGKPDPRDSNLTCNSNDGHGEIIGFRGLDSAGAIPYGLTAQGPWPTAPSGATGAAGRREILVAMSTAPQVDPDRLISSPPAWPYEPKNPNLDMAVDEMIVILQTLLGADPAPSVDLIPPATVVDLDPDPNAAGWAASDVEITYTVHDEGGSGAKDIDHSFSGAEAGGSVTPAPSAHDTITAEGVTTVRVLSRDNAGNQEVPQTFDVRIDRTPPSIEAVPSVAANPAGWNNTSVVVHFPASDALSGLASTTADVTANDEGAAQEIIGTAVDVAGNLTAVSVTLNIDRTPPAVVLSVPAIGGSYLAGSSVIATYACSDAVSGVASCAGSAANADPIDTSLVGTHEFVVDATDLAGNAVHVTRTYVVVAGTPRLAVSVAAKGLDAAGHFYVDVRFTNTGAGPASSLTMASLVFRTLTGSGVVTLNTTLSSPLPDVLGGLDVGAAVTRRLYLDAPATVLRFSIVEAGTLRDAGDTAFSYSTTQSIIR